MIKRILFILISVLTICSCEMTPQQGKVVFVSIAVDYNAPDGKLTAIMGGKDRELVALLVTGIVSEYGAALPGSDRLGGWLLCSILHVCLRSLLPVVTGQPLQPEPHDKYMLMLQYIRSHLSEPELLQAKALGQKFGMSQTYVGSYFKSCVGESLREYVSSG